MSGILNKDSNFIVKDSVVLDMLIAVFYFAIVISAIVYDFHGASFGKALLFGLLPGLLFIFKAVNNNPAITINKDGIYYFKDLVTGWPDFYKATVIQLPLNATRYDPGISERIILRLEYSKNQTDDLYKQELPLTNTQNKSEEEIIAAIEFFHELYKKENNLA